jgi:hypothetical protein
VVVRKSGCHTGDATETRNGYAIADRTSNELGRQLANKPIDNFARGSIVLPDRPEDHL